MTQERAEVKRVRVALPGHLGTLARVKTREVQVDVPEPVTQRAVLDALEAAYPTLRGAIRDQNTGLRRPLVRYFACQEDLSHEPPEALMPAEVAGGREPFRIVGAIAGG